ncbi:hypothetical protein LINGRAHAP2_LOCUS31345 [Linum grandiflorum]
MECNGKLADDRCLNIIRRYPLDANFHGILDLQIDVINKDLSDFLLRSFDVELGVFNFGNGLMLSTEARDVTKVLWYYVPQTAARNYSQFLWP